MLEGEHLIGVYAERRGAPETLIVAEDCLGATRGVAALAARFADRDADRSGGAVRRARDAAGRRRHAGRGRRRRAPAPPPPADFCLLLDDVQDPGNVGSMLRSAAAAGVAQVLLSKHCAFAWSPKVLRAGQGAHFHLDIARGRRPARRGRARYAAAGGERGRDGRARAGSTLFDAAARPARRARDRQRGRRPVAGAARRRRRSG